MWAGIAPKKKTKTFHHRDTENTARKGKKGGRVVKIGTVIFADFAIFEGNGDENDENECVIFAVFFLQCLCPPPAAKFAIKAASFQSKTKRLRHNSIP
jgi:hypothetical protein